MADLRIVDAPEIPTEDITGEEKLPTGGNGNYSITLDSVADYTKTKKDLADNTTVDGKVNGVRQELDAHIEDLLNPHQVTKGQIGLGNVNNTADADKPVSNSTQAAIISAVAPKADKTYVDNQIALKANKADVYTKQESSDFVNNCISTALAPINTSLDLAKRGIVNHYDSALTYNSGERVVLANGDIVKSTINGNTNNPNVNMTGWNYASLVEDRTYAPVLGSPVKFSLNPSKFSLRYGLSDPLPLDNNTNMFRGLTNKDAWAEENIGGGSVAFGRNGASVAYLSTTLGHDCITYGVASTAGGAGSGTGDPDAPTDGTNYGYCSFAHGKDTAAIGRISIAFGQECKASSIRSYASGMQSEAGAALASHPNGVASDGESAWAHGYRAKAYGDFSFALGSFITAYNGAQIIGRGINPGSPLVNSLPDSLAMGIGVDVPTLIMVKGDGTNGGFGKLGINTNNPRERVEVKLKTNDVVAFRTPADGVGKGIVDFQGTLTGNVSASIFRMEYTSPNIGSAVGVTDFYQNGINCLSFNSSGDMNVKRVLRLDNYLMIGGEKIIGGQLAAIADSTGTAADNQRVNNAILAALRSHGLIAT